MCLGVCLSCIRAMRAANGRAAISCRHNDTESKNQYNAGMKEGARRKRESARRSAAVEEQNSVLEKGEGQSFHVKES